MSDEEFVASSYDEENRDKTWYPSELTVNEWKQGKWKSGGMREKLEQSDFIPELILPYFL